MLLNYIQESNFIYNLFVKSHWNVLTLICLRGKKIVCKKVMTKKISVYNNNHIVFTGQTCTVSEINNVNYCIYIRLMIEIKNLIFSFICLSDLSSLDSLFKTIISLYAKNIWDFHFSTCKHKTSHKIHSKCTKI